ncbi:hypothetical protein WS81_05060 [Burkholderia sp. MSMB2040]|nr:hypothetical protein WS81_05060 [Burkholderia sp. MSMB2040]
MASDSVTVMSIKSKMMGTTLMSLFIAVYDGRREVLTVEVMSIKSKMIGITLVPVLDSVYHGLHEALI